eukprot:scaffold177435_cov21-Tisochrysis_lutea.AAC.1
MEFLLLWASDGMCLVTMQDNLHPDFLAGWCHPRPDFLAGIADHSTDEHTFNEGEYIMRQGDA